MWEYTRLETELGEFRPEIIIDKLNKMGHLGWEISYYNEVKHKDDYSFVVIMKREIK